MPIIKSAVKRMKQATKHRERNVGIKRDMKTASKAFMAEPNATTLSAAQSEIDTAVKKNLMKKATAARRKAALAKVAKKAGVKMTAGKKKTTPKVEAKKVEIKKKPVAKKAVSKTTAKSVKK